MSVMREIKFRVWNTLLKEYIPNDLVRLSPDGSFLFGSFSYTGVEFYKYRDDILNGKNIIEQYTGLKDKNGTEIYEGDIVQYHPRHNGVPYRVYWANESAKFLIGRKGVVGQELSSVMYNLDTGRIALEVIGNIHENPELLEEK